MEELLAYRQELTAALMSSVEALAPVVTLLPSYAWHDPSASDLPSPHFTLAHLRALDEQEFLPDLQRIQAEEMPVLPAFDDQAWMAAHYHADEPVQKIMHELLQQRVPEVDWLGNLPTPAWSRMGRHPWWGLRSFQWWVERQLEQTRQHQEQLKAFLT